MLPLQLVRNNSGSPTKLNPVAVTTRMETEINTLIHSIIFRTNLFEFQIIDYHDEGFVPYLAPAFHANRS